MEEARDTSGLAVRSENEEQEDVILEAQRDKRKVHFATLMDICHLKDAELKTQISEVQGSSRAPRTQCKRRFWFRK